MNSGEEVSGGFVIARGDRSELFEFGEEVLDQVTSLVEVFVIIQRLAAIGFWRNHGCLPGGGEGLSHPLVRIERLVGNQRVRLHRGQEVIGPIQIVLLAAGQKEADRIAKRIHQGVDLGAQASSGPPDRLVLAGFFWAPALC